MTAMREAVAREICCVIGKRSSDMERSDGLLWNIALAEADAAIATVFRMLVEVTPEMIEAWETARPAEPPARGQTAWTEEACATAIGKRCSAPALNPKGWRCENRNHLCLSPHPDSRV